MEFSQEEFDEIINIFSEESDEIIHRLNNNILLLEKTPENKDLIAELFRDAHSLKGAARMIGFNDIQTLTHKIEDILGLAKESKIIVSAGITDSIYKTIDFLSNIIQKSIRSKKEIKSGEYGSYLSMLERIIKTPYEKIDSQKKEINENSTFIKTVKKEEKNINARFVEIIYLLNNLSENKEEIYLTGLKETLEWLTPVFSNCEDYEVRRNLADISLKVDFVSQSSGILTDEEISDIQDKTDIIIKGVESIWQKEGLELIDYKELAYKKQMHTKSEQNLLAQTEKESTQGEQIGLDSLIKSISENLKQIESNPDIVTLLVQDAENLIKGNQNAEVTKVFQKLLEIFKIIERQRIRPEKEIINIIRQSIQSGEKLLSEAQGSDKEDINLLLQRLSITQQILSLSKTDDTISSEENALATKELAQPVLRHKTEEQQDFSKFFESSAIKTLRVDTQKLDRLVNQVGEVIISKIKTKKHIIGLESINNGLKELLEENAKAIGYLKYYDKRLTSNEKDMDISQYINFNKQLLSSIIENNEKLNVQTQEIAGLYKNMQEDDTKLNFVVAKLEQMVKEVRLLPLATIFHMIPRMIRDIAKEKGKEIELSISGSETNVDKKIIEEIKTPLVHIIRNSIDHGIESPEERLNQGKSLVGKIKLNAKHIENKILIEIEDDGNGVDIEKVRKKALSKGFLTQEELNTMTDEQIMNLIFWPGFTTEDSITDISGRGVGLDIVQTKISQLNGKVTIQSILTKGTKVSIELPVTMATIKSFIIQMNGQYYAIPMSSIKYVLKVDTNDIFTKDEKYHILYQKRSVPVFDLSETLGFAPYHSNNSSRTVIIVEAENAISGFIVDKLVGDQEILNKKLAPPLFRLKNISGITTLVTGESCLIINMTELIKSIQSSEHKLSTTNKALIGDKFIKRNQDYNILVVDDSITTRTLFRNILKAAGYCVTTTKDSLEAIELISHNSFDLIVTDIEMPFMDGFELSKRIKENPHSANIPIIITSSSCTEENKEKAKKAEIEVFVSKGEFNQKHLLSSIEYILNKNRYSKDYNNNG